MIRGEDIPNDRLYQPSHIQEVLADMAENFTKYFSQFAPDKIHLAQHFQQAIENFEKERPSYEKLLDRATLEEYEFVPGPFRNTLKNECPIIRRCLNSPAKVMDAYRHSFYQTKGDAMLRVVINLSEYITRSKLAIKEYEYINAKHPADLGISELDTDDYSTGGVIGGGIRSTFLYNARPHIFPNRSQFAIWAYYFLTHQKSYGFEDDSEFLMIYPDGKGTQQNYFYPYDLFTFYAIRLYALIEEGCKELAYSLHDRYRFVYVDTFLDFISEANIDYINALKPQNELFDY